MTYYQHGVSKAAQQAKELEEVARKKAAELARLNAELDARIEARKRLLKHVKPVPTYKPTPEMAAAWERFQATNTNPEPPEAGWRRRQAAARESALYHHDRRRKAA
jgi:hypothetical protein